MGFRTNGNGNAKGKAMGHRTNGISDQWVVGPMAMGCRTIDMAPLCL